MKQRPQKAKPKRQPQTATPPPSGRKWIFRLVAIVVIPLILFGGAEAALRLAGYGYCTSPFKKLRIGDGDYLVNNDDFSLRFFPPQLARFLGPIRMAANKPAGTYRIFIFGESAAMGDPEPAYGASRYLEALLSERYPDTHFEVVNMGITAINSHVVLPLARDCSHREGDLWIVYMGNNEMVGPFGAATIFGVKAPPLAMIRLNLAIQKTRVGQWLTEIGRKLRGGGSSATSWGGMEMFVGNQLPPDDPRREVVYRSFSANLHDIVKAGLSSDAKILLNTVAVSLKDCPPFASVINSNLPPADRAQFDQDFAAGVRAADQGDHAEAARQFDLAARLDPKSAELQFRWGQCLLQLTNVAAAREHLQLACDDDALPFRADSRLNAIIRNEAKETDGGRLALFDAATALAAQTPANACGQETFFEHVHFNPDGNYRLGRAWAERVAALMPGSIADHAVGDWAPQEACEARLGLSDWNRALVIQSVVDRMQQPPLNSQLDNAARLDVLKDRLRQIHLRMNATNATSTREQFIKLLELTPNDHYLYENFTLFLDSIGDVPGAVSECRRAHDLIPQDCVVYFQLGRLLELQGQYSEAESSFRQAVAIRPSLTAGWVRLGDVLASEGKNEAALDTYSVALKQHPEDSATLFHRGKVLAKQNRHAEAMEAYRAAIRLNPSDWEPHFQLGGELDAANQLDAARIEFGEAARLNPGSARTHFNHGVLLAKQGRLDEAQREFEESIRLDPGYKMAQTYLSQLRSMKKEVP